MWCPQPKLVEPVRSHIISVNTDPHCPMATRVGRAVCLIERGPYPGSKNVFGGVVYGRVLDALIPNWWEEMPTQRWITRRSTMVLTDTQALTVDALRRGDTSAAALAGSRASLEATVVLADHPRLRGAPHLVLSERAQLAYPQLACTIVESMFRVDNPTPKPGLGRIARRAMKDSGVRLRDIARDTRDALRSLG